MQPLHVEQLAIDRGDRRVLEGLSFTIAPGEIVHLTGRNGAGKTSLLETLCGLRRPRAGTIQGAPTATARHWIGHRNGLSTGLTPIENLRHWAALDGLRVDDTTVHAAVHAVGLDRVARRLVGSLSTGQRRRAALARLVLDRRAWWFLDEPLAGLDTHGLAIFDGLLREHAAQGGAALVTSHQPLPHGDALRSLALAA